MSSNFQFIPTKLTVVVVLIVVHSLISSSNGNPLHLNRNHAVADEINSNAKLYERNLPIAKKIVPKRADFSTSQALLKEAIQDVVRDHFSLHGGKLRNMILRWYKDIQTSKLSENANKQLFSKPIDGNFQEDGVPETYEDIRDGMLRTDRSYYGWLDFGKRSLDQDHYLY